MCGVGGPDRADGRGADARAADARGADAYDRWRAQLAGSWPEFLARRQAALCAGGPAVAAAITHALLTTVLGWRSEEICRQNRPAGPAPAAPARAERGNAMADAAGGRTAEPIWELAASRLRMPSPAPAETWTAFLVGIGNGRERCVLAISSPGGIPVRQTGRCLAMQAAAQRARVLGIGHAGVCDGGLFYLEDGDGGSRRARLRVWLGQTSAPGELWWATPMGMTQPVTPTQAALVFPPAGPAAGSAQADGSGSAGLAAGAQLHPRLQLPAACFAFVGDPMRPATWKLPYRRADGRADLRRLIAAAHHAAASLATPIRGGVPYGELPVIIHRLADAARELGQLPPANCHPSGVFQRLAAAERRCRGVSPPRMGPDGAPSLPAVGSGGATRRASGC